MAEAVDTQDKLSLRQALIKGIAKWAGKSPEQVAASTKTPDSGRIPKAEFKYPVSPQVELDPAKKDWIPKSPFPYETKKYAPQGTAAERFRLAEKDGITKEQSDEILKQKKI